MSLSTYLRSGEANCTAATNDLDGEEHREQNDERKRNADHRVHCRASGGRLLREAEDLARSVDGAYRARLGPLAVRGDDRVLEAVDELGERDVLAVPEDVDRAELLVGAVPELEAQELACVWWRRAAELDREGGAVVGCTGGQYMSILLESMVAHGSRRAQGCA